MTRATFVETGDFNLNGFVRSAPINLVDLSGLLTAVGGVLSDCGINDPSVDVRQRLTRQCNEAADKITDDKLKECVKRHCKEGRVRCGTCDECKGKQGFDPGFDPGKETNPFVVFCPKNLAGPFTSGDLLAHEFAHTCGWEHTQGDKHVPDWPRDSNGDVDWKRACQLYPEICKGKITPKGKP